MGESTAESGGPRQPAAPTRFGFALLGPLAVLDPDGRAVPLRSAKARTMLAALLLSANRVLTRERLTAELWGERVPATAGASLNNLAMRLRRLLEEQTAARLDTAPGGYLLRVAPGELDVDEQAARLDLARQAWARQDWPAVSSHSAAAAALWRGEPLADLAADGVRAAARQLTEAHLQALEWHAEAELRLGNHAALLPELSSRTAQFPLHEVFHGHLILALQRSGRQAEALLAFERVRGALAEELGADPGQALRELHQALLTGDPALLRVGQESAAPTGEGAAGAEETGQAVARPAAGRPTPSQLPADTAEFTGRAEQVKALVELLAPQPEDTGPRIAVVTGMSGIGKTALAVHAARLLHDRFPGGRLFADLHGFGLGTSQDPHDLLGRFLGDLSDAPAGPGVPIPGDTDGRAALLRTLLTGRQVLIVLDNARDAAQVLPLLPGSAGCSVLITSRNVLPDLPGGHRLVLEPLDEAEQREMLAAFCGADRIRAEAGEAARILDACAGLPLALRIVGAKARVRPGWPLRTLAEQLDGGGDRLQALATGSLSVQASFAAGYGMLRDSGDAREREAARVFRLLGRWHGDGLTAEAVAALVDGPVGRTTELLGLLGDVHLVQNPAPGRYRFHDLVGEYAAERLAAEEPAAVAEAALLRLLGWYTAASQAASSTIAPGMAAGPAFTAGPPDRVPHFADAAQALAWCVRELPNLREAIGRAALGPRPDLAWRLALNLFGYATTYWWTGVWDDCLHQALATARAHGDREGRAWVLFRLGVAHRLAYRYQDSLARLLECLPHFESQPDLEARAGVYANLSRAYGGTGRPAEALDYAHRALDLFRRSGSARSEAPLLSGLAAAHRAAGDYPAAEAVCRQVLAICRELGYLTNVAIALEELGDTLRALGRRDEALASLAEALTLRRQVGDTGGAADTLVATGWIHAHFGESAAARACFDEARGVSGTQAPLPSRPAEPVPAPGPQAGPVR
ncbi:AfsR/SARP family transcriptional regulator [Kitasatospora viridis]|uniref:DNA-binding SARP family transcriptional activator n=1 Tax=Kitasatospora viridis TaxID=281105 RepID=A0A561SEH6_9ACTN|nr:BTAD domain-containing putative transcriptional regulator [Kitasatospora viridis]TWF73266.1 DNA-binding SARP family transcriptional activator [Kitasatospora viridis]